ncbi:hypothetical protein A9G34_04235 [Gilliamella sp. Choc4-2]|uniref:acyltransferase family protein n=1 Tax=unclassified Gilliamella TaxID=2685620 RepID=UPI00080EB10C|nr:acyltransferase family protein [Gilliamella apicola]OCG32739.1 hypothetical protein A9G33_02875 [Gilliamella apicola]OCG46731.1 hypothetical protein A9G34_04235 [Gilliamella apicola]
MKLKYRSDIDGLRALAVLSVIIYHLNNNWLQGGFIGVDIFFVISGFLITKIIYSEICNNTFSFKNFYQRRINRILPVFFCVMLLTSIFTWYLFLPKDLMLFLRSLKSTTYFWENMFFAQNTGGYWDTSAESMPILHTWSLAVEEQFYIILPVILLILLKMKQRSIKLVLTVLFIIAFISFLLAQISPESAFLTKYNYYSLFTGRAGELLIGSIIGIISVNIDNKHNGLNNLAQQQALLIRCNIMSFIGLIGIVLSITFISDKILFPSFWAVIPAISAATILYCYHPKTIVSRLLSLKPVVFVGKISYSLYLWHWPIIVLTRKYLFIKEFNSAEQYIIVSLITLILSIISYFLIERPCRINKRSFKYSFITYYIFPVLVIFSVYYMQKETKFLDYRYKEKLELYKLQGQYLDPSENFCISRIVGDCVFGDKTKKPNIVLFGDSHSGHYSPYLDEAGKKYGFAVKIINAHACTFLPEQYDLNLIDSRFKKDCEDLRRDVTKAIEESKIIIYAGRYNGYDYNGELLIVKYLPKFIDKTNKKFIVLAQVPWIDTNEHERFIANYLQGIPFTSSHFITNSEKLPNKLIEEEVKGKAIFFNPLNDLNEESKKEWPIYNGLIAYSYDGHLGEYVTRQWSKEVLPKQKEFWKQLAKEANE